MEIRDLILVSGKEHSRGSDQLEKNTEGINGRKDRQGTLTTSPNFKVLWIVKPRASYLQNDYRLILTLLLSIKLDLHDLYLIWGVINECIYYKKIMNMNQSSNLLTLNLYK